MSTRIVKSQAEFDQAMADGVTVIDIRSERGVWIYISDTGSASVRASGSASVRASGSASVSASDSASVRAFGSASVRASGSASVSAFGSASVSATPHVAVHLHSKRVTHTGGVIIDITDLDLYDPATWADHTGAELDGTTLTLYKAVTDYLKSDYGTTYPIGKTVTEAKYRDDNECGNGLHLCPTPGQALDYFTSATRFLACAVNIKDVSPIIGGTAKCKVRKLKVLHEVDVHGRKIEAKP